MRLFKVIVGLLFTQFCHSQSDTLILTHEALVYFDSGDAYIREDQNTTLDSLLIKTNETRNPFLNIVAHTDLVGKDEYNQKLSNRRAASLAGYFINNDIDEKRIDFSFYGENKPLTVENDESSRQQNRRAKVSIFTSKKRQWVKGKVIDGSNDKGVEAKVSMHSKSWSDTTNTDVKGNFKILVPKGEVIGLDIIGEGYLLDMRMMKVTSQMETEPITIALDEIDVGKKFLLKRLFFVGNEDYLLENSFNILPVLLSFMEVNRGTCITINGHINLPNADRTKLNTRHHDLSIARARRIFNYLLSNGIEEKKMLYRGFGNWYMAHPKARNEGLAAKNRRVEVIITDCDRSVTGTNDTLSLESHFFKFYHQDYGLYK